MSSFWRYVRSRPSGCGFIKSGFQGIKPLGVHLSQALLFMTSPLWFSWDMSESMS